MLFLLYSEPDQQNGQTGLSQFSYNFHYVMNAYAVALGKIGTVQIVPSHGHVDQIFEQYNQRGENCIFLPFASLETIPRLLKCPTIPIVSWELSNVPDEICDDDPNNAWRPAFVRLKHAIALSNYAAGALASTVHSGCAIYGVPAPIVPRVMSSKGQSDQPVSFRFAGVVIDSNKLDVSADLLAAQYRREQDRIEPIPALKSKRAPSRLSNWLPFRPPVAKRSSPQPTPRTNRETILSGIVYTAILDPARGRRNWISIITAFCWAFRNVDDATLVLVMEQNDLSTYENRFVQTLCQLAPFKCRIIAIQNCQEKNDYEALINATSFYVDASSYADVCLPMMDFMACGVPAISPAHTAMVEFVDDQAAFVLRMSLERDFPAHDPREVMRAKRYRLDWESLRDAYASSYYLAKTESERVAAMRNQCLHKMQAYCSIEAITRQLLGVFNLPTTSTQRVPAAGIPIDHVVLR